MDFIQRTGKHGLLGEFLSFTKTSLVRHGFTTRTLSNDTIWNLDPRQDNPKKFQDAMHLLADALNCGDSSLILSQQVHGDVIRLIKNPFENLSHVHEENSIGADGLITACPGVALVTFYADCVPLFILDPVGKAIGLSHAGWKGTLLEIGPKTLKKMADHFRTDPKDVLVGIGPSIGPCCFEVGHDVADTMTEAHPWWIHHMETRSDGKILVNLWEINKEQFLREGVQEENITIAGLCTKCEEKLYHSFRREGASAGRMAAILVLNP